MTLFDDMTRSYIAGCLPWDQPLPPPEVLSLAERLPPGRALDLGCGAARACIYLAQRGWQCDGVDFVPEAIELAKHRVDEAGVSDRVQLHCASVAALDFLEPPYDLAIDVGCVHNLRGNELRGYAQHLARLLRPAGLYVLFARLADTTDAPRGLTEATIRETFAPAFTFLTIEHGESVFAGTPAPSAWFWLQGN